MATQNTFYFDSNKLVKVEELALTEDKKELHFDWYYWNDQVLYYTHNSEKSEAIAKMLLEMAMAMQQLPKRDH